MVADAAITALPAAPPIYVEIDISTSGGITAFQAPTLAAFIFGRAFYIYSQNLPTLSFKLIFDQVRNYSLQDTNLAPIGTLSFKFTTSDTTYNRKMIFKLPDSFFRDGK